MLKKLFGILAILIFSASLTSTSALCSEKPQYGGTVRFIYHFSPAINIGWPQDTHANADEYCMNFVYTEPLVLYKADTSVDPWLATSWDIATDYKSITFHLRKGVKFHDGTDFNADAVKFNFDAAIKAGKHNTTKWESVEVLDDYTVRLNLKEFQNTIWADLMASESMIVSPTPIREKGVDYARENPCGTGPFKFVGYARDEYVKFEKNPDYWQPGKPYLDKIEFYTVVDEMTYQNVLKAGKGEILGLVGGKTMSDMKKAGFLAFPELGGTDFMSFDTANADSKFSDIRVRQAMEHAINKKAIADALGHGFSYPNNQLPSPFLPHHDPSLPQLGYDLEKAKELLTAAGFPNGFNTKWITPPWFGDAPLIIQESLKKIGVNLVLEPVTNAKYWEIARTGWKDAILAGSVAPDPNFAANFRRTFPPYGNLHVSVKYPDGIKELLDKALAATDPAVQKQLNFDLVRKIDDDKTFVFYVTNCRGYVVAPHVHNGHFFEGAQYNYFSPADLWLSKK
ncbi:MAG: ABC transporter substrate-binding protein [Deltaproteobacteria bacterium]|nr:ABC transporter substrate-binding protein [Deltaproteobacteria bacterium]